MPTHDRTLVPIYHPELDAVSYVSPRSVRVWQRSGWQPGDRPRSRNSKPRTSAKSAEHQTPAATAAGTDDSDQESPALVKEN